MSRRLSPYEKTHLKRYGQTEEQRHLEIQEYGQMPVEYITGRVEFLDQIFLVNEQVMIPRIESEELIATALDKILSSKNFSPNESLTIADVGCGSGALGLSLYLELRKRGYQPKVYLSDISAQALKMARLNKKRLTGDKSEIKIFQSDLLEAYPLELEFDFIIANLPYIPSQRVKVLDQSVKNYEPHLALDGGPDGLKYIKPFLKQAGEQLKKDGLILLEVDHTHHKQFLKSRLKLKKLKFVVKRDQFQKNRFLICSFQD